MSNPGCGVCKLQSMSRYELGRLVKTTVTVLASLLPNQLEPYANSP